MQAAQDAEPAAQLTSCKYVCTGSPVTPFITRAPDMQQCQSHTHKMGWRIKLQLPSENKSERRSAILQKLGAPVLQAREVCKPRIHSKILEVIAMVLFVA